MEITAREDLGNSLWAPQHDGSGKENWTYALLTYVQPGDRVFHWSTAINDEPAIIGWSEARGPLSVETKSWQARGTSGRARGTAIEGAAWVMPLEGMVSLGQPITRSAINEKYADVLEVLNAVRSVTHEATYAPFYKYRTGQLRATQGYLTKFPAALVAILFPVSSNASAGAGTVNGDRHRQQSARSLRHQAYMHDAEMRSALERHALGLARALYEREGATSIEELGKPYDLKVVIKGQERHVEVKGSTGIDLSTVHLTQGEVLHANSYQPTDLIVVDAIQCRYCESGSILNEGGTLKRWCNWSPSASALTPTQHRYELPTHAKES